MIVKRPYHEKGLYLNDRSKFHDFGSEYRIREEGIAENGSSHQEEYRSYHVFIDKYEKGKLVEKHVFGCEVLPTKVKVDIVI